MAIINFRPVSGFVFEKRSLEAMLRKYQFVKRYEINGDLITFYFDEVSQFTRLFIQGSHQVSLFHRSEFSNEVHWDIEIETLRYTSKISNIPSIFHNIDDFKKEDVAPIKKHHLKYIKVWLFLKPYLWPTWWLSACICLTTFSFSTFLLLSG